MPKSCFRGHVALYRMIVFYSFAVTVKEKMQYKNFCFAVQKFALD
jgi:hypothetical protein